LNEVFGIIVTPLQFLPVPRWVTRSAGDCTSVNVPGKSCRFFRGWSGYSRLCRSWSCRGCGGAGQAARDRWLLKFFQAACVVWQSAATVAACTGTAL